MGAFRVSIEVGDPAGQRYETVETLVDTGATYATLSAPLLRGRSRGASADSGSGVAPVPRGARLGLPPLGDPMSAAAADQLHGWRMVTNQSVRR